MSDKLQIVYEPKGAAREYAELACNLYTSCRHGCRYCYVPGCVRKTRENFAVAGDPVKNVLERFEHDAKILKGDSREILFCFTCDPYMSDDSAALMQQIYPIAEKYNLRLNILTKAGFRFIWGYGSAARLAYFSRNGWKFGSTICFKDERRLKYWEPGAPSIFSRIEAVAYARYRGIYTWVSLEPVIYPDEVFKVIDSLRGYVCHWKIGKINHDNEFEKKVDWVAFREKLKTVLAGENYYLKKSLTDLTTDERR